MTSFQKKSKKKTGKKKQGGGELGKQLKWFSYDQMQASHSEVVLFAKALIMLEIVTKIKNLMLLNDSNSDDEPS